MALIYKITNPKGRIYIGQTIDWIRRQSNYKRLNCKSQTQIYNSIKKYGWDLHIKEIIEECSIEDLGKREKYWKDYYNSIQEGMNIRYDEEKGGKLSKSTCEKISKSKKGVKYSKESSLKKSLALKNKPKTKEHCLNISKAKIGKPNPNKGQPKPSGFGKKLSENRERNEKISKSHLGKLHPRTPDWSNKIGKSKRKPIIMLDMNYNPLMEFEGGVVAGKFLGKNPSLISEVCRGIRETAFGYRWKFKL